MIKYILLGLSIWITSSYTIAQPWNNLIPNYSFESTDVDSWLESGLGTTTEGLGDMRYTGCSDCFEDLNNYEKIVQYWSYCDHWTVPKRRYAWCGVPGEDPIATPDITYEPLTSDDALNSEFQRHFSGQLCAYTGTGGSGEFAIIQPEETIEKGKFYYIEAFVGTFDETSEQTGTIDLFTQKPHVCSYNKYITEYGGNGPSQTVLMCAYPYLGEDSLGWTRYRGYFQATENFEWLSIGSAETFYWDDIKIIKVTDNLCRDNWYFDNTVFNYPKEVFQASGDIVAGFGVDPEDTHQAGPVTVLATSHTVFRAGNEIILEDGFEVDSTNGAIFEAIIEPCQDICPPTSYSNKMFQCISNPTAIGFDEYEGTFAELTWYPSTYLDDPNSPNPTFTPPGDNGTIIYTVHYEKDCYVDDFNSAGIFLVFVNYSDGLDTPAEVSYSGLTYDNYLLSTTINVNDVVDEVEICYTNSLGTHCFTYYRGSDFDDGTIDFSIDQINASCCSDVVFNVTAKSYCGSEATTSFTWEKEGDFGFIGDLPNIITPLTPDGINDEFCFEVNLACSYTLDVIHPWGTTLFSTSGTITEPGEICPWQGQKDNGDMLPNGNYWVHIVIFNDCGEEEMRHEKVYIPAEGMMQVNGSGVGNGDFQALDDSNIETKVEIITEYNQLYVVDQNSAEKDIIITDYAGRIIAKDKFSENYSTQLSSGVYFVSVLLNETIITTEKIVIL